MIVTTSSCSFSPKIYETILELFKEYIKTEYVTCSEFIESKVKLDPNGIDEEEIKCFVLLAHHREFLDAVKSNFVEATKIRNCNDNKIIMFFFSVLFILDEYNLEQVYDTIIKSKFGFKQKALEYLLSEHNQIMTALAGCKIFEDEYVLKNIIHPLLNKSWIIEEFIHRLEKRQIRVVKPPTVPEQLNICRRRGKAPMVPLNTPEVFERFKHHQVPKSTYNVSTNVEERLVSEHEKNKKKAQVLLKQAKIIGAKNFCKPLSRPQKEPEGAKSQFKAKKAPKFPNTEIKANITTVLREANFCIKERENAFKELDEIMKGGSCMEKYRELEAESKELYHQKTMEDVERKHLEGLLTFEEALLARKKLLAENKERFKQFKIEQVEILGKIDEWKEKEQAKIQELVRKAHEIENNAKESEKKVLEEKQMKAAQLKDETKSLLMRHFERIQEELARKTKLIQEIKVLHQLRMMEKQENKEFDPNDCPNLGLLCQMSIAELQERLVHMKMKMEEELELKRNGIREHKRQKEQFIRNVKLLIAQARMSKPKPVPIRTPKIGRNPDLDKLRKQLERTRDMRKGYVRDEPSEPAICTRFYLESSSTRK